MRKSGALRGEKKCRLMIKKNWQKEKQNDKWVWVDRQVKGRRGEAHGGMSWKDGRKPHCGKSITGEDDGKEKKGRRRRRRKRGLRVGIDLDMTNECGLILRWRPLCGDHLQKSIQRH